MSHSLNPSQENDNRRPTPPAFLFNFFSDKLVMIMNLFLEEMQPKYARLKNVPRHCATSDLNGFSL